MALQKTVITSQGFDATDAYHRVENVTLKSKDKMMFMVMSYKNKENSASFNQASYQCSYNLAGDNPIKQAYNYLKTTPDYVDATDC